MVSRVRAERLLSERGREKRGNGKGEHVEEEKELLKDSKKDTSKR